MMRADISPGAPRDNGHRARPHPGDHRHGHQHLMSGEQRVLSVAIIRAGSAHLHVKIGIMVFRIIIL